MIRFSQLRGLWLAASSLVVILAAQALFPKAGYGQSFTLGGDVLYARPVGQFLQNVKQGWGFGGFGLLSHKGSPLALRVDIDYVEYGHSTQPVAVGSVFGSYIVNQTTSNNIFDLTVGPQLTVPVGPVRPYVNLNAGLSHFYTESTLDGVDTDYYNSTESSDWQLTYGYGAGVTIPMRLGFMPISIDAGARYHINGETTYLTRNDIQEDPETGDIVITPRKTDARFLTYRLGIEIGF